MKVARPVLRGPEPSNRLGLPDQLSHTHPVASATFDDPNLVLPAGLMPVMALADKAGLRKLADERATVPGDKGSNAGLKLSEYLEAWGPPNIASGDRQYCRRGPVTAPLGTSVLPSA